MARTSAVPTPRSETRRAPTARSLVVSSTGISRARELPERVPRTSDSLMRTVALEERFAVAGSLGAATGGGDAGIGFDVAAGAGEHEGRSDVSESGTKAIGSRGAVESGTGAHGVTSSFSRGRRPRRGTTPKVGARTGPISNTRETRGAESAREGGVPEGVAQNGSGARRPQRTASRRGAGQLAGWNRARNEAAGA